jgi:hypothetical protein
MKCWREPSLEDILSDPITQAVISADGVDTGELDECCAGLRTSGGRHSAPPVRLPDAQGRASLTATRYRRMFRS